MSNIKDGFYTALGTPLEEGGGLAEESFRRHVEDQIQAGAAGLLALGSMGNGPCIAGATVPKVARAAAEAARGRCPVFVGVMDNSVGRVLERAECLSGLPVDGIVATTPFYFSLTQAEVASFFASVARRSKLPLYLYDLPAVTKTKIAASTAELLARDDNIRGIKTGDLATARELTRRCGEGFSVFFSGLDVFDVAYGRGLQKNLDGMFCCTAGLAARMYWHLNEGEDAQASACLDNILALRNKMAEIGVIKGFTCAMNLLGYEGSFSPDYAACPSPEDFETIRLCMTQCGALN